MSETIVKNCSRCKQEPSIVNSRKEDFCKKCFLRFIRGKQRKQMQSDNFKVVYTKSGTPPALHRVLVTVSFGLSSLVLVDVIVSLLNEQLEMHRGKQGFEMILLNIDENELKSLTRKANHVFEELQQFYAPINFSYKVLNLNSFLMDQSMLQKITLYKDFNTYTQHFPTQKDFTVGDILSRCPNRSTREDMLQIIYDQLILRTAVVENCGTVLLGHCMTRIANEVISLTVKGRGSSIHDCISDRFTTYNDRQINIIFPLRDILQSEIEQYATLAELKPFVISTSLPKPTITKNMTIQDLTTNYFNNLEATGYASVASTVVKTGDKLGNPQSHSTTNCKVCNSVIHKDPKEWLRTITVNDGVPLETKEEEAYFQEYVEATPQALRKTEREGSLVDICYGCMVTLGVSKDFVWPVQSAASSKQVILNEYILTDDEEQ